MIFRVPKFLKLLFKVLIDLKIINNYVIKSKKITLYDGKTRLIENKHYKIHPKTGVVNFIGKTPKSPNIKFLLKDIDIFVEVF